MLPLKIDLTFRRLVNTKVRCSKREGYRHYDYQCPLESQRGRTVPSDDVDGLRLLRMFTFLLRLLV